MGSRKGENPPKGLKEKEEEMQGPLKHVRANKVHNKRKDGKDNSTRASPVKCVVAR